MRLADIEEQLGATERSAATTDASPAASKKPKRKPLPAALPRETVEHAAPCACPACGDDALRRLGEDVTEVLDYVPGAFRVIRHVRPKFSCRSCETIAQAPVPSVPIRRGGGAGLIAHVLVSKYCDHLPLHRQAEIYARSDIDLPRSTLADLVGQAAHLLRPLVDALARHVMAGERVHADDTTVPVLAPGLGRTRTGRSWVYVRDDRPFAGPAPPGALYRYTPDRKGEHPREHLREFRGILQADGYAGFAGFYGDRVVEAACLAHARRKFFDEHVRNQSPIAAEALRRIAAIYAVEKEIRGRPPEQRLRARSDHAAPLMAELHEWLDGDAQARLRAQRTSGGHPIRAVALGRADAVPPGRPRLHRQLGRRARNPPACPRPAQLDVRGFGCGRRACRGNLQPHRNREAQRN